VVMKLSDLKKNRYIGKYVGESESAREAEKEVITEQEPLSEREITIQTALKKLELAHKGFQTLTDQSYPTLSKIAVPITTTRKDVIEALRKLREAGGKFGGLGDLELSSGIQSHETTVPNAFSGGEPKPSGWNFKEIDVDPELEGVITFDDYMYAMDIVKLSLPPAEALEETEDIMPEFSSDYVRYSDNVYVDKEGNIIKLEEGDPQPFSRCIPSGSWFTKFLLKLLMYEGSDWDLYWIFSKIAICPLESIWNFIVKKLRGMSIKIPLIGKLAIGELLFSWLPYSYLAEEAALWLARKKQALMCRPLYLFKSYGCCNTSINAFLEAHPDDRLAVEVVSKLDSEVSKKLRESDVFKDVEQYEPDTALNMLGFINARPDLFSNYSPPDSDNMDNLRYSLQTSVPKDILILCGSTVIDKALSRIDMPKVAEQILNRRIMKLFNMKKNRTLSQTITDILNYRIKTGSMYLETGIFPGD